MLFIVSASLIIWLAIFLLPWKVWRNHEQFDSIAGIQCDLSEVTILIPARDESSVITETLSALKAQDETLKIVLVDDQSTDATAKIAESFALPNLQIIHGTAAPPGWSGKLWALEQGWQMVRTKYAILLDADIVVDQDLIPSMLNKLKTEKRQLVSLMAVLQMRNLIERLFLPAFIFFFKLLYPFSLVNQKRTSIAAAAGGFMLFETEALRSLGGFSCIHESLIDDCSLAKKFKQSGHSIWLGLTKSVISTRRYHHFSALCQMIARSAYAQLHHSIVLLLLCIVLMGIAFIVPCIALIQSDPLLRNMGLASLLIQFCCYIPILRYYAIHPFYVLSLPFVAISYLIITCYSAYQHHFGAGVCWKKRHY